jgi:Uma2 family endonuclease
MAATTLVSVEEYLSTSYDPDVEYVDGELVERNVGDFDHARLQALITACLVQHEAMWGITTCVDPRTQVLPTRFRLPDICVQLAAQTEEPIIRKPPFLCIEILSKDDRADAVHLKIEEYLAFGVSYIWIIHYRIRQAYIYTAEGIVRAPGGLLKTSNPDIVVPLAEIWPKWKR